MTNAYQSTSLVVMFKAFLDTDHVSEATGKTIAMTISKNGGAFGNPNAGATNATEVSAGWYKFTLDTTDTNTVGPLAYRGTNADIDDVGGAFYVIPVPATQASVDTIDGIVDAILVDTGTDIPATLATIDARLDTEIPAILAAVDTEVAAIKAKTDNLPSDPADASDIAALIDALPTAAEVWGFAVDGSITAAESLRLNNAAQGGKASGMETTTATIRNPADTKNRIVATVDADGNRSAVTLDLS